MMDASGEYRRLDKRCMASRYVSYSIGLIFLVICYLAIYFMAGEFSHRHETMLFLLALLLIVIAYCILAPPVFYRHYKYFIDDEKLDVVRGVITITRTIVPIERIMQVQVTHGPINRLFGLANVDVTTAGGTATLEYLEPAEAEQIAARLAVVIDRILKERNSA
ncbi:MAG: PH domain-containing protein [Methanomethylophilus sp.]|nr:PH domain-containing protein [Methanomethylophilus sp.]MDD4221612.1 PH domain-containing protein [Methanomethylophilus sp.]